MKTIQHEFSLELYQKAKENPNKYEFVYRDGTKPLGVYYMEGNRGDYPFISWRNTYADVYSEKGHLYKNETESSKDLFILEKVSLTYRSALESLPDGYRELALENAETHGWYKCNPDDACVSMALAIGQAFAWSIAIGEFSFWKSVQDHYAIGTPLPPLPVKEVKIEPFIEELIEESIGKSNAKQVDQERLDKFVCAALTGLLADSVYAETFNWVQMASTAISVAKETIKQLEGGEK